MAILWAWIAVKQGWAMASLVALKIILRSDRNSVQLKGQLTPIFNILRYQYIIWLPALGLEIALY